MCHGYPIHGFVTVKENCNRDRGTQETGNTRKTSSLHELAETALVDIAAFDGYLAERDFILEAEPVTRGKPRGAAAAVL